MVILRIPQNFTSNPSARVETETPPTDLKTLHQCAQAISFRYGIEAIAPCFSTDFAAAAVANSNAFL